MSTFALVRVLGWGQLDFVGMEDPVRALAILQRRVSTGAEAAYLLSLASSLAGNRGQPSRQAEVLAAAALPPSISAPSFYAAGQAVRPRVEALRRAVLTGTDTATHAREELVFWQLWEGGPVDSAPARAYLAALDRHQDDLGFAAYACLAAARLQLPDGPARLRHADSLANWLANANQVGASMLVLARCHEVLGDRAGALAAVARRPLDPVYGPNALAGYLYEEGRLALLLGDGARARRAWSHLLTLRDDPEPALAAQTAWVRATVDSLSRN